MEWLPHGTSLDAVRYETLMTHTTNAIYTHFSSTTNYHNSTRSIGHICTTLLNTLNKIVFAKALEQRLVSGSNFHHPLAPSLSLFLSAFLLLTGFYKIVPVDERLSTLQNCDAPKTHPTAANNLKENIKENVMNIFRIFFSKKVLPSSTLN